MTVQVPFALPDITDREINEVVAALRSGWITTGPRAKDFEKRFAAHVGAEHAVAMNSCTAALHLALEAIGLTRGDEVILPTLTFAATAEVVRYFDAKPVLVDVLRDDHQIDPAAVERALTPRTKAVIPVHFAGQACDLDAILSIAKAKGIRVIEDAAHSFPTTYKGKTVGGIGDVTCFSFYATKPLATGEGGMATTNNAEWAERMRIMSLHGISKDAWKRYSAEGNWYYEIVAPGYKYNMTDVAAAMGLAQLERTTEMLEKRTAIAARYFQAFSSESALELPLVRTESSHSWHLFVVRLRPGQLRIDRAQFVSEVKARGIGCSVHFIPLHMHPYYRETYGTSSSAFPVATDLYERSLSLPIYSKMTEAEVSRVVAAVIDVNRRFAR
jgi:dTDP-4-amino-4,6-dideoxygalactose transaminase